MTSAVGSDGPSPEETRQTKKDLTRVERQMPKSSSQIEKINQQMSEAGSCLFEPATALAMEETQRAVRLLDELAVCWRLTMEVFRLRFVPEVGPEGTDSSQKQSEKPDPGPSSNGWLRRADSMVSFLAPFLRGEPTLN